MTSFVPNNRRKARLEQFWRSVFQSCAGLGREWRVVNDDVKSSEPTRAKTPRASARKTYFGSRRTNAKLRVCCEYLGRSVK